MLAHSRHLFLVLLLTSAPLSFAATVCTDNCGVISIGQPKLWSLSDAQYLVGEARERLKALRVGLPNEPVGLGILNPNEIHLRELNILLQSLGVNVQYDQKAQVENQRALDQASRDEATYTSNRAEVRRLDALLRERREQLEIVETQLAEAKGKDAGVTVRVAAAEAELTRLKARQTEVRALTPAAGSPEAAERDAELSAVASQIAEVEANLAGLRRDQAEFKAGAAELSERQKAIQAEITRLEAQRSAANTDAPTPPSLTTTGPAVGADGQIASANLLSELFKDTDMKAAILEQVRKAITTDPKAPYVQQLNNVVDGYLQTISHRLTMLRQSVDPNYDLYFMEATASVEPSKKAKHHIARARWMFAGGTIDYDELAQNLPNRQALALRALMTTDRNPRSVQSLLSSLQDKGEDEGARRSVNLDSKPFVFEMSPGQAAVNIARSEVRESRFRIVGIFKTLIGWGGGVDYQRQRDIFRQFLQQDVFIAAQGKGSSSEFGWDFSPMPGSEYLAPGAYTSYGVIAIPKFWNTIRFATKGDWTLKPERGGEAVPVREITSNASCLAVEELCPHRRIRQDPFSIKLPEPSDYWIDRLLYDAVPAGEEISVIIMGKGFSQETSVLINNIPLDPRWRLIDPTSSDVSYSGPRNGASPIAVEPGGGERKVVGSFELMSSDSIAMKFRLPDKFVGIPQITVISPRKSIHINDLRDMKINWDNTPRKLSKIHEEFINGEKQDLVMFQPSGEWKGSTAEVLRVDDFGFKADIRVRFRGISELGKKQIHVFTEAGKWEAMKDARLDANEWQVAGVPVVDGFIQYQVSDENKVVYQSRVSVGLRPRIDRLDKSSGPAAGGTEIEITGFNFAHTDKVYFGGAEATVLSRSDKALRVRSPKGSADSKAAIRVVSGALRDGKELASTEADKVFTYAKDSAAAAPKPSALIVEKFPGLPRLEGNNPRVDAIVAYKVASDAGKASLKVHNGTTWIAPSPTPEELAESRFSLTNVPTQGGKLRIRLYTKKGNEAEAPVDELSFDVPFTPTLNMGVIEATKGTVVILRGTSLQSVTDVQVGRASLKPTLPPQYDQLTFIAPDATEAGADIAKIVAISPLGSADGPSLKLK